jgi:hypothetical protein
MKNFLRVLFIGLVFFTIVFGSYQLFIEKADADLFRCDWAHNCVYTGQDCSDSIRCDCKSFGIPGDRWCGVGAPIE